MANSKLDPPRQTGPVPYVYKPRLDISAYEVALITPILVMAGGRTVIHQGYLITAIENLPYVARRHFEAQ
jgi:hypothetical protein